MICLLARSVGTKTKILKIVSEKEMSNTAEDNAIFFLVVKTPAVKS